MRQHGAFNEVAGARRITSQDTKGRADVISEPLTVIFLELLEYRGNARRLEKLTLFLFFKKGTKKTHETTDKST